MEGTLGAVSGFAAKLGSALGTFLCGVLLSAAGYVGGAQEQTAGALAMIRALFGLYKLDGQIGQIRADNEKRRAEFEAKKAAEAAK